MDYEINSSTGLGLVFCGASADCSFQISLFGVVCFPFTPRPSIGFWSLLLCCWEENLSVAMSYYLCNIAVNMLILQINSKETC